MWYKRLDPVHVGCQGNPGLCVYKAILECERTPACGAISWWLGAMGHSRRNNGDAGSVFLVAGVTMANIRTTARKHNGSNAMVKNSACKANMGSSSSSFIEASVGRASAGARKSPTGRRRGSARLRRSKARSTKGRFFALVSVDLFCHTPRIILLRVECKRILLVHDHECEARGPVVGSSRPVVVELLMDLPYSYAERPATNMYPQAQRKRLFCRSRETRGSAKMGTYGFGPEPNSGRVFRCGPRFFTPGNFTPSAAIISGTATTERPRSAKCSDSVEENGSMMFTSITVVGHRSVSGTERVPHRLVPHERGALRDSSANLDSDGREARGGYASVRDAVRFSGTHS